MGLTLKFGRFSEMVGKLFLKEEMPGSYSSRRESKAYLPGTMRRRGRGGYVLGKNNASKQFPGFPIHIFPLMSGTEHPFLLRQLGYGTEKSKINGMLCEQSLEQLDIAGHNRWLVKWGHLVHFPRGLTMAVRNPVGHGQAGAPRTPNPGPGRLGFSSMGVGAGGEEGGPAVRLGLSPLQSWALVTIRTTPQESWTGVPGRVRETLHPGNLREHPRPPTPNSSSREFPGPQFHGDWVRGL